MDSDNNNENKKISSSIVSTKGPKIMKMLSENKLKRLNILTFINDKKEILFTKKAFKFEKERIWRQIFQMMRDSGMVSAEKDWRYVRDVSFSNWRKRAQKRLKHLAANGYRLNMDECEFLISDILGQTPDKTTINGRILNGKHSKISSNNIEDEDNEDDESDEYMIDSDEEDDAMFVDEMLLIPKVVINDIDVQSQDLSEKSITPTTTNNVPTTKPKNPIIPQNNTIRTLNEITAVVDNRSKIVNNVNKTNGLNTNNINGKMTPSMKNLVNNESNCVKSGPTINEYGSQRLLELEIENKILKNRYMKLKIIKLEKNLGFDHCNEVKELLITSHQKTFQCIGGANNNNNNNTG